MIQIKDFMVKEVITVESSQSIYEAAEKMVKNSVSCLVVTENKKPIGLVTERSIMRNVLFKEKDLKKTKVKQAMHEMATMGPEKNFFDLVEFMKRDNLRRVVIVDKEKLVGIVTETDVVNTSIKLRKWLEDTKGKKKGIQELLDKLSDIQVGGRKVDSGYEEMNSILQGGLPRNKSILLVGPPGSGKGLIAFNFMKRGLESNDKVLYICMNEFIGDIKELFASIGINIDRYMNKGDFRVTNLYKEVIEDTERIYNEEEELLVKKFGIIKKDITDFVKDLNFTVRCVVNVISQSLVMHNPKTVYRFVLKLNELLKEKGVTTLYFMHAPNIYNKDVTHIGEIMDGIIEFIIKGEGKKVSKVMTIRKMKPEFAVLPQVFSYDFDKEKRLHIKPLKG